MGIGRRHSSTHNSSHMCCVDCQFPPSCPINNRQEIEDGVSGSFQILSFVHHREATTVCILHQNPWLVRASLGRHSAPYGHTLSGERKTQHTGVFQTSGEAAPYPLLLTTSTRVGKIRLEKATKVRIITIATAVNLLSPTPCMYMVVNCS